MSIEEFKEALVGPLKKSIEQHRSVSLSQFRTRDDLTKQWDISVGMELSLNHIESTFSAFKSTPRAEDASDVEFITPQN